MFVCWLDYTRARYFAQEKGGLKIRHHYIILSLLVVESGELYQKAECRFLNRFVILDDSFASLINMLWL